MIVPNDILFAQVCEYLESGKSVSFQVKGFSMLPFLVGDRDSVNVEYLPFVVGDAVLAHLPDSRYVLHRVYKIDGNVVVLKGDGNLRGTEKCRASDVKGKVTLVLKHGNRSVDVEKPSYKRRVKIWNGMPYIVRRVVLALCRRVLNVIKY